MISDYSVITATLNKKIVSMKHAMNDHKYFAALTIMRDIEKDLDRLIEFTMDRIEVNRE